MINLRAEWLMGNQRSVLRGGALEEGLEGKVEGRHGDMQTKGIKGGKYVA